MRGTEARDLKGIAEKSFGLLGVGNELLSGKVVDLNLKYWIEALRRLGQRVAVAVIAPDERGLLSDAIRFVRARCDTMLISGGIGPTHDDLTLPTLAEALGRRLVRHDALAASIRAHYGAQSAPRVVAMADLPEGMELLYADELIVPVFHLDGIYLFPGDPGLMRRGFALLEERRFGARAKVLRRLYSRLDESAFTDLLATAEAAVPGVSIGSYPRYDGAAERVLITIEGRDAELVERAAQALMTPEFAANLIRTEEERVEARPPTES